MEFRNLFPAGFSFACRSLTLVDDLIARVSVSARTANLNATDATCVYVDIARLRVRSLKKPLVSFIYSISESHNAAQPREITSLRLQYFDRNRSGRRVTGILSSAFARKSPRQARRRNRKLSGSPSYPPSNFLSSTVAAM